MTLSMNMLQQLSLVQSLRLSIAQRLAIQMQMMQFRLDLHEAVHERRFEPTALCPNCNKELAVIEILRGFTDDPSDITTQCPICKSRFSAHLHMYLSGASSMELEFYCPVQTMEKLRGLEMDNFEAIKKKSPSVFYSALLHFGTLKNAFKQNETKYPEDPKPQLWQDRVVNFLGRLPDKDIAEVVGVGKNEIANLRRSRGIKAFRKRDLL